MTDEDGKSRKFKIIKSSALDINLSDRVTKSSARNNMLNARNTKVSVGDEIIKVCVPNQLSFVSSIEVTL